MKYERRFVYFAEKDGRIKIGCATDVPARMYSLKAKLLGVMVGNLAEERSLHRAFAEHRLEGEWFADNPDLRRLIGSLPKVSLPSAGRSGVSSRKRVGEWR